MIYIYGAGPRLLDVASGRTRRFGHGLREHVRQGVAGATAELRALAERPADELWEIYGDLQVVGEDVWFSATLTGRWGSGGGVHGLFRADLTGTHLNLVTTMPPHDRIEGFVALPDRSAVMRVATYQRTTITGRSQTAIGPSAHFLDAGWSPLLTSDQAEFGFHVLPGGDDGTAD